MRVVSCVFFITFSLIFIGFIMPSKEQEYQPAKEEQLVHSVLGKTAKIIENKYKIQASGSGASMPGGPIQELTLCFDANFQLSKEDLRKILINIAQELLNRVENNLEIQKYLKHPPFKIENIQIIIYNHDKNGRTLYDPLIGTAEISNGFLTYRTFVRKNDILQVNNDTKETYEEALKILLGQAENK